jgi:dethiobiotin synthetase
VSTATRDLFVTGTDTGVGKTVVSAVLGRVRGAVYVKPVQSGAADGDDDCAEVAWLADVPTVVGPVVGPSLAPAVAVRRAGERLEVDELLSVVAGARVAHPDRPLVVEGAGGLLVELGTDGTTCADLAGRLGLAVVVVARPGLGTLNHTALTLAELERRGLELAGVVVSGYPGDPDLATRTNLAELDRLSDGRLLGVVPRLGDLGPAALAGAAGWLAPDLGGHGGPFGRDGDGA